MMYQDPYNIVTEKENKEKREHRDNRETREREHKNDRSIFRKHSKHDDIITEIKEVPVTMECRAPHDSLEESLGNAGLPRAVIAASKEVPNGTPGGPKNKTVLQQHVQFWDTDHDNVISPLDTWNGFRRLGFNIPFSAFSVAFIHFGFSYVTQKSWIPDPFLKINVDRINKDKHGSDSETFDTEGRFIPEKFEEIFSKYDSDHKGGLNFKDITRLIQGNANAGDPFGWIASFIEWGTLYLLCAKDGIVVKEDLRTCYDGTLFFKVAESKEKRQGVNISSFLKGLKEELNLNGLKEE